jgi:hypothetical protein
MTCGVVGPFDQMCYGGQASLTNMALVPQVGEWRTLYGHDDPAAGSPL